MTRTMIYDGFRKSLQGKHGDNALGSWHWLTLVLWKLGLMDSDERLTIALMLIGRLHQRDANEDDDEAR